MKNRIVILLGATVVFGIGLSSCSNNGGEGSYTQEQLDSIAQYRIDSANLANKLANDSIINARADSLAKAESSKSKGAAPATQSKKTPTAVKKAEPTKANQGAGATVATPVVKEAPKETTRTQADIEADEKAARFGDKAAQERLKKDEELEKAARFGDKKAQEELKKREAEEKADRFKKQ